MECYPVNPQANDHRLAYAHKNLGYAKVRPALYAKKLHDVGL